jgi:hypothetical protein
MRRVTVMFLSIALSVAVLAGCSPTPAALSEEVSTGMQSGVVAVAEAAAAGDSVGALARLDELQQKLDAALAAGEVSAERAVAIQTAIDAVRADLQPVPEPSVEPLPEQTVDPGVTDDGDDNGNDNSGPGNNNGNSENGKGKEKDKDD